MDKRDADSKVFGNEIVIDFNSSDINTEVTSILVPEVAADYEVILPKMLFGAEGIQGKSTIENSRKVESRNLVGVSTPKIEGLNSEHLKWVTKPIKEAIEKYAIPGCQLVVLKNGSIILNESYGYFTYDSLKQIEIETMYDLASLTKSNCNTTCNRPAH